MTIQRGKPGPGSPKEAWYRRFWQKIGGKEFGPKPKATPPAHGKPDRGPMRRVK